MKRWMILALVAATGVLFTACDRGEPTSNPETKAEGATAEQPEELPPLNLEVKPQRLALGWGFSCYLNDAHELWCWGWGEHFPVPGPKEALPPTKQEIGVELVSIAASHLTMCGLDQAGQVHCFGQPLYANLKNPDDGAPLSSLSKANSVFLGGGSVCIVTLKGGIECLGADSYNILGGDHFTRAPHIVPPPDGDRWVAGAGGQLHVCALSSLGSVWCWGDNNYGQLGIGTKSPSTQPALVSLGRRTLFLAADGMTTCAVVEDGSVWCWGSGDLGALGQEAPEDCGESSCSLNPLQVSGVDSASQVSPGSFHGCSLNRSGTAECWGAGRKGQLGVGDKPKQSPPRKLALTAKSILCENLRCCAELRDGGVVCWGDNGSRTAANVDDKIVSMPTPIIFGGEDE